MFRSFIDFEFGIGFDNKNKSEYSFSDYRDYLAKFFDEDHQLVLLVVHAFASAEAIDRKMFQQLMYDAFSKQIYIVLDEIKYCGRDNFIDQFELFEEELAKDSRLFNIKLQNYGIWIAQIVNSETDLPVWNILINVQNGKLVSLFIERTNIDVMNRDSVTPPLAAKIFGYKGLSIAASQKGFGKTSFIKTVQQGLIDANRRVTCIDMGDEADRSLLEDKDLLSDLFRLNNYILIDNIDKLQSATEADTKQIQTEFFSDLDTLGKANDVLVIATYNTEEHKYLNYVNYISAKQYSQVLRYLKAFVSVPENYGIYEDEKGNDLRGLLTVTFKGQEYRFKLVRN